jgi:hypothetical protein
MSETNAELISRRAEDMAAQIADQMAVAHELNDQDQINWLHSLIQHLVVIRQAALAIREEPSPLQADSDGRSADGERVDGPA